MVGGILFLLIFLTGLVIWANVMVAAVYKVLDRLIGGGDEDGRCQMDQDNNGCF